MTMTDVGSELVHAPAASVSLAPTPDSAREAMRLYQSISSALIEPDEDMQTIQTRSGARQFPKRSAFQKLANAYRVSTKIVSEQTDRDGEGNILRHRVVVRAIHPDGRYSEGDGACSRTEDRFGKNVDKIEHDLPATAVTRAKNRAIADLIAFGAVSAEEAEGGQSPAGAAQTPDWALPMSGSSIPAVAENITRVLKAAGVEQTAPIVERIGETIFKQADGGFPFIAARVVHLIAEAIEPPEADVVEPEGELTTDATRAEADEAAADTTHEEK